jgi:hypothetical protein
MQFEGIIASTNYKVIWKAQTPPFLHTLSCKIGYAKNQVTFPIEKGRWNSSHYNKGFIRFQKRHHSSSQKQRTGLSCLADH